MIANWDQDLAGERRVAEYICTGTDPDEARRILGEVATELRRRTQIMELLGQRTWTGQKLNLTVHHLPGVAQDQESMELLAWIVRVGRKVGVVGVVHGGRSLADVAGSAVVRDMLAADKPLYWNWDGREAPDMWEHVGVLAAAESMFRRAGYDWLDRQVIEKLITAYPHIDQAVVLSPTDPVLALMLRQAVSCHLLNISDDEYQGRLQANPAELDAAVRQAHDRWVAANPPEAAR